jgi:hypothetical protein
MDEQDRLKARIQELTNWPVVNRPRILTDTSDWMRIQRGDVVRQGGCDFVIEGNRYESRFGLSDQPKFWVFGAVELENGKKKILKAVFHEDFNVHIGSIKVHCYREPEKESRILDLIRGDHRFMQGYTELDDRRNHVRIIDFIKGQSIYKHIYAIPKDYEQYFNEDLPSILWKLAGCIKAIAHLHDNKTCHGDIRSDHIFIETETGNYRWIDFDLNQHQSDFDVWSMGNILSYAVGKGINTFHQVLRNNNFPEKTKQSLESNDASAFYEDRIINLRKLYPCIPQRLNDILMRFAVKSPMRYGSIIHLLEDYQEMLEVEFLTARQK